VEFVCKECIDKGSEFFISESSGGITLFSFSRKCKLSTGAVQGVHRLSRVSEFQPEGNC
jgi:hypothetical protein